MNELYITYRKRYVLCTKEGRILTPKMKDGTYSTLTDGILKNHLQQYYAVAILAGKYSSRFLCFDVDDGQPDTVHMVIDALVEIGFPRQLIYISLSGGKGYHVEMFFDGLVRTNKLKDIYARVIDMTGCDPRKLEFRPTHGNAIKLPLSVHPRTGKVCWFVEQDTLLPIERHDYLFEIKQIPAIVLDRIHSGNGSAADEGTEPPEEQSVPTDMTDGGVYEDLDIAGTRHNRMRRMAVNMRMNKHMPSEIREALIEWYERQDTSKIRSSREEVLKDIDGLVAWVFSDQFIIHLSDNPNSIRISTSDMKGVLTAGNRSEKRILFLLLARSIADQKAITLADIASTVALSRPTVIKAIRNLCDQCILECRNGTRKRFPDGNFSCESNQYTVHRRYRSKGDKTLSFSLEDLMLRFDDCYYKAISELIPFEQLSMYLSVDEDIERTDFLKMKSDNSDIRLDLCGQKLEYTHDQFGLIVAFGLEGRVLYPLGDVAQCMELKYPDAIIKHCAAKEKWKVQTSKKIVVKNFIEKDDLRALLKRSRSRNKQELINWLCK